MANVAILPACFMFGLLLRWSGRFTENSSSVFNAFIINVSLPALTLLHIQSLRWDDSLVYPISMAWGLFGFGALFFVAIGLLARWSRQTIGALILTGALANTSFLGLPMIEAFYGSANGAVVGLVAWILSYAAESVVLGLRLRSVSSYGQLQASGRAPES